MRNYLLKASAICLLFSFFSCSQETATYSNYEESASYDAKSVTRSCSTEEAIIAEQIQTRLDSIGAKYGKTVLLSQGTDVRKVNDSFFEFVEKSLCLEDSDWGEETSKVISVSGVDGDSLMDDSSINKIGVRSIMPTEVGYLKWEVEELIKMGLCIKFTWTIVPSKVTAKLVYDTSLYSLERFLHGQLSGPYEKVSFGYTLELYNYQEGGKEIIVGVY